MTLKRPKNALTINFTPEEKTLLEGIVKNDPDFSSQTDVVRWLVREYSAGRLVIASAQLVPKKKVFLHKGHVVPATTGLNRESESGGPGGKDAPDERGPKKKTG
jgi:hypothetical protein